MKTQVFTVSAAQLNTGNPQEQDPGLTVEPYVYDGKETGVQARLNPNNLNIWNESNVEIGFAVIADAEEYNLYSQRPEYFDFIPLKAGGQFAVVLGPSTYRLVVTKLDAAAATGEVRLIILGYK